LKTEISKVKTDNDMKLIDEVNQGRKGVCCLLRLLSDAFETQPLWQKRLIVLAYGIAIGAICGILIFQGINGTSHTKMKNEYIKLPKDIYMENENQIGEEELIPVGKLKGEIDGEFEAFYLAVDANGTTYINRSIEVSREAYHKSKGWETITKEVLDRFKEHLHFLPIRSRGIKH
jgi:hypothetical protein